MIGGMNVNLETEVLGFKLENPIMPASGPLVGDFSKIMDISNRGVGAVVTKTISTKSAVVPRPCIYAERNFVMNAELWSELPPQEWIDNILPKLREELDKPLIVSVGYTEDDMEFLIPKLDPFADAFEVSTHYVGKDIERIGRIVRKIRSLTKKPIAMKMSPHIPDPVGFAKMVKENGGNAVVAINSVGPSMKIDVENRRILFGDKNGFVWLSGPYIKPIALAMVHAISSSVNGIDVIGVGGIRDASDVVEFLLAGAKAVQLLSSALIYGKDIYRRIIDNLPKVLKKYGFESVKDVVSTELKVEFSLEPKHPRIDLDRCTLCGICEMVCPYWAIWVFKDERKVVLQEEKCFGCGLCESRCPVDAISGVFER